MKNIVLIVILTCLFSTYVFSQFVPAPWPDKEPKFESAFFMRAGVTVRDIDESLLLYRDILGMKVLIDRKGMFDSRLLDFSGLAEGETIRLTVLAPQNNGKAFVNAGYIALSEISDARGQRLPAKANVKTSGSEPGSIMLQFLVDDTKPIHKKIVDLGYEIISAPSEKPDGTWSELLVRDPNGIRLWITDRYSRTIFLERSDD